MLSMQGLTGRMSWRRLPVLGQVSPGRHLRLACDVSLSHWLDGLLRWLVMNCMATKCVGLMPGGAVQLEVHRS